MKFKIKKVPCGFGIEGWYPREKRTEEERKYFKRLHKRLALVLRNIELLDYAIKNNIVIPRNY